MRCAIFIGLLVTVIALGEARTISRLGRELLWFTGDNSNDHNNHDNNNIGNSYSNYKGNIKHNNNNNNNNGNSNNNNGNSYSNHNNNNNNGNSNYNNNHEDNHNYYNNIGSEHQRSGIFAGLQKGQTNMADTNAPAMIAEAIREYQDDGRLKLTSAVLDAIKYAADCLLVNQHTDKRLCDFTLDAVKQLVEGDEKIVGEIEKQHPAYLCYIWERISDEYESAMSEWSSEFVKDEDIQRIVEFIKKEAESSCRADESHDQKRLPEPMIQQLEGLLREQQKQPRI